ncbi:bifunctional sugar-1-phosphate nucleotidylyltransferase/acetyltransferase [Chloroflexota bacterium]
MKAVILAAGEGKRMYPLTSTSPKVMMPVANKPLIEHLLSEIYRAGIQHFIIVVGYRAEKIRDYFRDGSRWGVKIEYVTQRKQLGTSDAVRQVLPNIDQSFLLANGDVLIEKEEICKLMLQTATTVGLAIAKNTSGLGVVELEGDTIIRIHEKPENPPTNLANTGVYFITPDAFPSIYETELSQRGEYEFTHSLQMLIDRRVPVLGQVVNSWHNISYPWDLIDTNEALLGELETSFIGKVEEGAMVKGPVLIGEDSLVRSGSYIEGPAILGSDCHIGPNCYIRPFTAIGDRCHIGSSVEIKNSIIMKDTKIPHHNYVGDSVIGEKCNIGAGTKIANLRLDKGEIHCMGINTYRKKLGAILGENVQVGINASINVGTVIGHNSTIGPGALVNGMILPNSRIM